METDFLPSDVSLLEAEFFFMGDGDLLILIFCFSIVILLAGEAVVEGPISLIEF